METDTIDLNSVTNQPEQKVIEGKNDEISPIFPTQILSALNYEDEQFSQTDIDIENSETDGDFILKSRSLQDDINDELLNTSTNVKARKNKSKSLCEEEISYIYKNHQCGFVTSRPIFWAQIIEKFITDTPDVTCRWQYKLWNNVYIECKMDLFYDITKKVTIFIHLKTGVIMVKGNCYKEFCDKYFSKLVEAHKITDLISPPCIEEVNKVNTVENSDLYRAEATTKTNVENEVNDAVETPVTIHQNIVTKSMEDITVDKGSNDVENVSHAQENEKNDKRDTIETLWKQQDIFNNAIKILESTIEKLSQNVSLLRSEVNSQNENYALQIKELEIAYDKKLSAFTDLLNPPDKKYIDDISNLIKQDIHKCRNEISRVEVNLNKKLRSIEEANINSDKVDTKVIWEAIKSNDASNRHKINVNENEIFKINANMDDMSTNIKKQNENTKGIIEEQFRLRNISQVNLSLGTERENIINNASSNFNGVPDARSVRTRKTTNIIDNDTKLLLCMDSNRRYIDKRRLWTVRNSRWLECGNMSELSNKLSGEEFKCLECVLINVGVNDTDTKTGKNIHKEITEIITRLRIDHHNLKIILCELTPRCDDRDVEVIDCNKLLYESYKHDDKIFIVEHSNMRDVSHSMFSDTKHVSQVAVGRFAANLKKGLRAAFGVSRWRTSDGNYENVVQNNRCNPPNVMKSTARSNYKTNREHLENDMTYEYTNENRKNQQYMYNERYNDQYNKKCDVPFNNKDDKKKEVKSLMDQFMKLLSDVIG